jgi:hypothetical protein
MIENNWFDGGINTVNAGALSTAFAHDITLRNNIFARRTPSPTGATANGVKGQYLPESGTGGISPINMSSSTVPTASITGNLFDDGAAVPGNRGWQFKGPGTPMVQLVLFCSLSRQPREMEVDDVPFSWLSGPIITTPWFLLRIIYRSKKGRWTMADSYWSGLGVADGTTLSTGNINTTGNSDAATNGDSVAYGLSGTPTTAIYSRQALPAGPGISVAGPATSIARLDLTHAASRGGAVQVIYTPSGNPTTSASVVAGARSSGAGSASVFHATTGPLEFRNTAGATAVSGGATPNLVAGHSYQIDMVVDLNSGTPSTTNGRLVGQVMDLTDSTWNTTGVFYVDTGYTIDAGTAQITQWRVGKSTSGAVQPQSYYTGIRWGERTAFNTTTDPTTTKAQLITNPNLNAVPAGWSLVEFYSK